MFIKMATGRILYLVQLNIIFLISIVCLQFLHVDSTTCTRQVDVKLKDTTLCWSWNLFRCSKYRTAYRIGYTCCSGWTGSTCNQAICNGRTDPDACYSYFANSYIKNTAGSIVKWVDGTCDSPGICTCSTPGFYSAGSRCDICSNINNCNKITCTTKTNQECGRCDGLVRDEPGFRAYSLSTDKKTCDKACSWRNDSTPCYPGTCPGELAVNCDCSPGFGGYRCDTIMSGPRIKHNILNIRAQNGKITKVPGNINAGPPQDTVWTNILNPVKLDFSSTATFQQNIPTNNTPAYVKSFVAGITGGMVKLQNGLHDIINYPCNIKGSPTNLLSCNGNVTNLSFRHLDRLEFSISVSNGGNITIEDKENNVNTTRPLIGATTKHTFYVSFDDKKPYHCKPVLNCNKNMLNVVDFTKESNVSLSWAGWLDDAAGIDFYDIEIYELKLKGDEFGEDIINSEAKTNKESVTMTLSSVGVYSVILSAHDKAGNHKSARRIVVLVDSTSVTTRINSSLRAITALPATDYKWQSDYSTVSVNWANRFENILHESRHFLAGIQPYPQVDAEYDDNDGLRTIKAINNKRAITKFKMAFDVTRLGGSLVTQPPEEQFKDIGLNEEITMNPDLQDGDTLQYFIRAYDVVSNNLQESITVHFDSSPPVIENLWLTKGDEFNISVHGFKELNRMVIEWVAYDDHSGLIKVEWKIYDNKTQLTHGSQIIPPQGEATSLEECKTLNMNVSRGANCYCIASGSCFHRNFELKPALTEIPENGILNDLNTGVHNHDYHIEVTVTNNALLATTATRRVTIDTSPPHEGVVHDGKYGRPEVDFQTGLQIYAHWEGFFDRESGVKFYQYGFALSCLKSGNFDLNLNKTQGIIQTTSTHASWTAPGDSKYFITVVAYNRALEPSKPVCSDGVTIDRTPPVVSEIDIEGARIIGGLVKVNNSVFYISDSRRRYLIKDPDVQCMEKAQDVNFSDLNLFPLEKFLNGSIHFMTAKLFCSKQPMSTLYLSKSYLAMHSHLHVNWTGSDLESGIYDYQLGLASAKGLIIAPDHLSFTSTHHHSWYRGDHAGLDDGTEFFISIKAINKAGNSTIEGFGPFIVHRRTPTFNGEIYVKFENGVLEADWSGKGISDPEFNDLKFTASVGTSAGAQDVLPYSPLSGGGNCILTNPPNCTAFDIEDLHWNLHHNFTYYVSIRVENIVDLSNVFTSRPYVHNIRTPSNGVVFETLQPEEAAVFNLTDLEDSNFQLSTKKLSARWFGFDSDDLLQFVTYRVGVGSKPGITDITEISVGNKTNYTFLGLSLAIHQTYYITVTANNYDLVRKAWSNGITVVTKNADLANDVQINDGAECGQSGGRFVWVPNHHIHQGDVVDCNSDMDYQISTTIYMAHWNISDRVQHMYPDVKWTLQVKLGDTVDIWSDVVDRSLVSNRGAIVQPVSLETCKTYRSLVKFCSGEVCSKPIVSDGVKALSEPWRPRMEVVVKTLEDSELTVVLTYRGDDKGGLCPFDEYDVDKYMWSITDNKHDSHLLTRWNVVSNIQNINKYQFSVDLKYEMDFSKCRRLSVRIFNKVGLSTTVSADIKNCSAIDPRLIISPVVIDVLGDAVNEESNTNQLGSGITLEENAAWYKPDIDYTPYTNIISAVWPTLRYSKYKWGLLHDESNSTVPHFMDEKINLVDPCSHPNVLVCGETENNFINAFPMVPLKHGRRYHVCIYADAEVITHEKWREGLTEVRICSNGVTVDLTPPNGGRVWVASTQYSNYQSSSSEVSVYWDNFIDVEEVTGGFSVHPSGISQYYLAIGSVAGGEDVINKRNVGLINHKIFHHLSLQDGHTYYITVQAVDFVNRSKTVYSEGFVVDNSPPVKTSKPLQFTNTYLQSDDTVTVCWGGSFKDDDSGISQYRWSVGSRPGHQDVMEYIQTSSECGQAVLEHKLLDGHTYYVTVEAINGADMSTTLTSRPITVEMSHPTPGHVWDVMYSNTSGNDIDYITDQSTLSVRWQGFHDPQSAMKYYKVKLGTCDNCEDVMEETEIGIYPFFSFPHQKVTPGTKYITTVTGCNMADLCTSASSDGVIVDVTVPIAGRVLDGTKDRDIDFQASRNYIGAKWYGFKDAESGIERYEWRVGTTVGGEDILPTQIVPVVELAYIPDLPYNKQLPIGTRIYITVRCYNKAGMYSESTSNGFVVDDTPPIVTKVATMSSTSSNILPCTTISRSSITIEWQFIDDESNIEKQYISISPHIMGDFNTSAMMIPSMLTNYSFTSLDLHDGSKYTVKVIGCNLAGLCTSSSTDDITVDASPPTRGMFAINTDHAANLNRHRDDWMRWSKNAVNISWLGFSDLHTGIVEYIVSVGTEPFFRDLHKNNTEATFQHVSGDMFDDEGVVQMITVETKDLQSGQSLFISIWAINGVGLKSQPIYSEFLLVDGGMLDLVRRCNLTHSCTGLCVCAAQDGKCPIPAGLICKDVTEGNTNSIIEVTAITDRTGYSTSDNFLVARWRIVKEQLLPVVRYEVSAGYLNNSTPTGIYISETDKVWFEVGQNTEAILMLPKDKTLETSVSYCVFVRAWYSNDQYAVFKSPGITPLTSPPGVSYVMGAAVKELETISSNKDIDFQSSTDGLIVGWKNKFRLGSTGVDYYLPYISTHPLGHNIHSSTSLIPTDIYTATNLQLEENREFFSTVLAYNKAGLVSWASSDGITIDKTPPVSGEVHDGDGIHDMDYTISVTRVSASWYGFTDTGSGIESYYWCIGIDDSVTDCSIKPWTNMGLYTRSNTNLSTPLAQGTTIYHKVYAVDGSVLKSDVAVSNGITIDTTPPNPVDVRYIGDNLIHNPSFEDEPTNWIPDPTSYIEIIQTHSSKDGVTYAKVRGQIQQRVSNLTVGRAYHLIVHVGYPHDVSFQNHVLEGFVQFGTEMQTFNLDPQLCQGLCDVHTHPLILWNKYTYVFHPTKSTELIIIGTNNMKMELAVDDVYLLEVNYIDITSDSNHLIYHTVFTPYWSALHLTWHFTDDHSPITEYKWALGTVKGGTQVKSFTSLGRRHHVTISDLKLVHNTKVYVTVVATNAVGLSAVTQSASIIVDMTLPVIAEINDGFGADVDFQSSRLLSVNWRIEDEESGIDYCIWAIGTTAASVDVQPFTLIQNGRSFGQTEINETLIQDGSKVYSTIRCYNKAGLPTTAATNGVFIISNKVDSRNGNMVILKDGVSQYPVGDQCQSVTNSLRLQWNLADDRMDSKSIQVSVSGEKTSLDKEIGLTDISYDQATLTGLNLQPKAGYNISISTINILDRQSATLSTNISTIAQPPRIQELSRIQTIKAKDGRTRTVSWENIFTSSWTDLYYEVSVGTIAGAADVIQWQETRVPSLSIRLPDKLKSDLYLTITAVDQCGLFTHQLYTIAL